MFSPGTVPAANTDATIAAIRRARITRRHIDRDYPYQVEIVVPAGGLGTCLDEMGAWAMEHGRELLLFTGARPGEILTSKWDYVDLDQSVIKFPDSKTGKKPVFLNSLALGILTSLPRIDGNPYVIVGNFKTAISQISRSPGIESTRSLASMTFASTITAQLCKHCGLRRINAAANWQTPGPQEGGHN